MINTERFNPADYGLSERYCKRSRGGFGRPENCDIYMYSNNDSLSLKMPPSIGQELVSRYGERVNFDFRQNGQVFIWPGEARKISKNTKYKVGKWSISMDMALDDYTDVMGTFKRLYMDVVFYDTHVVFSPNGKRKPPKQSID